MNDFIIREASITDAKELIEYLNLVGGQSNYLTFGANEFNLPVEQKEDFIRSVQNSNNEYLIAISNEKVVGSICSSIFDNSHFKHNINFDVTVLKDCQGMGIGKALVGQFIDKVKVNPEISNIVIEVRSDNSNAIKLYEKLGFTKVGEIPNNFKSNDMLFNLSIYHLSV